ncbi:MAG: tetratricopeptide repeat protein [Cyanobacteria bacterium P01_H01_bin.58]
MRHPARLLSLTILSTLLVILTSPNVNATSLTLAPKTYGQATPTRPATLSPLTPLPFNLAQATDRQVEADTLFQQVIEQLQVNQSSERQAEADRISQQGLEQLQVSQFQEALQSFEQALIIYREIGDRTGEANTLRNIGVAYKGLENYSEARNYLDQSLLVSRELGDHLLEAQTLTEIGDNYSSLGNYREALNFYQQSLTLFRELDSSAGEADNSEDSLDGSLNNWFQGIMRGLDRLEGEFDVLLKLGNAHEILGDYQEALNFYEQYLFSLRDLAVELEGNDILDEESLRATEATIFGHIGSVYFSLGDYSEALAYREQSLSISRELGDRAGEASRLNEIGNVYNSLGNYSRALDYYEQSLSLDRELGNRAGEAISLNNIGTVNSSLGNYEEALDYHEQSLPLDRELGNHAGIVRTLTNIGNVYQFLGNYSRALDYYEQSLSLDRELGNRVGVAKIMNNIGTIYRSLGNYEEALNYHEQSLSLNRELGSRAGIANSLNNIGTIYSSLGNYEEALDYHEQGLTLYRELGHRAEEASSLNNIGLVYSSLGNYDEALDYYEQSLSLGRELGDRAGVVATLINIGAVHNSLGNYDEALDYSKQSLSLARELGKRASEAVALGNIGKLLNSQVQPELAIIFLKASVEVSELIREDNRSLDLELQQSYTDTIADDYRLLAQLLLEQGRIPEAQQVLDLLKLEELREFTNTRATWTGSELAYTAAEQSVIDAHGSLIALGSAILTCEDTNCAELNSLYDQREALTAQYNDQVNQFANTIRANRRDVEDFQDPQRLSDDAKSLLSAYAAEGQTPVLIYPFVLEDKLWLVWAIEGRVIGSAEVPVTQGELATTVQRFGELLTAPTRLDELQAQGQQLYNWIIQPLEAELAANDIDHLIFVNDRVTRYIPMAALYDGDRFLAERYQISTVLTPGTTDTRSRLADVESSQVLGLGLTQAVANFNPLPAVATELDGIVQSGDDDAIGIYPGQVLLNEAFTLEALKANLRPDYQVLHLATHAAFVPGRADESFIVMGNGDRLTTADIEDMNARLDNLHLVILSACQTAVGGPAGDGAEITGISSYFLGTDDSRAETVIASLWAVNDTSTSILMQRFYELLATGELTKAEALRQAQLSLLYDEDAETRLAAARRGAPIPTAREGFDVAVVEPGYRHPYYWAPFILIGNGL